MKRNTRQEIIESAIKLISEHPMDNPSLSDIVANIGISKAAIYRHFKNKKDLDDEIERIMNEEISEFFQVAEQTPEDIGPILKFFTSYSIKNYSHMRLMFMHVMKSSFLRVKLSQIIINKGYKEDTVAYLFLSTLISSHVEELYKNRRDVKEADIDNLVQHIITCLDNGILDLPDIDRKRVHEIFISCIPEQSDIKEDKYLSALSSIIVRNGISSITIKNIAQELGQAESTLYSKFTTKEEMIEYTASKEFKNLIEPLRRNMDRYEKDNEKLISMFSFIINYVSLSPDLTWFIILLSLDHNYYSLRKNKDTDFFYRMIDSIPIKDIYLKHDSNIEHLKYWCFLLAVVQSMTARTQSMKDRENNIFSIYEYIRYGIYTDNKENI
ncbi:MAG: TetR/AcrR family transcriptional regulator [Sphaerochaetaceae bacterium]|nr:TetR/AcrR family transcriptional regulator [Sphaerochaetaceae bacterium]